LGVYICAFAGVGHWRSLAVGTPDPTEAAAETERTRLEQARQSKHDSNNYGIPNPKAYLAELRASDEVGSAIAQTVTGPPSGLAGVGQFDWRNFRWVHKELVRRIAHSKNARTQRPSRRPPWPAATPVGQAEGPWPTPGTCGVSNRSLTVSNPVSGPPPWKLKSREQRFVRKGPRRARN
jgi:hypothetical protein